MPSVTIASILDVARSYLGTTEHPDGSNNTIFNTWFGEPGVAWCAIYVSYCFHVLEALELIGGKQDYTPDFARWFYDRGQWGEEPRPGAIVFFNFGDPNYGGRWKGIHHVGIVEAVQADGRVIPIEGNTDNAVRRRVRSPSNIAGYGYPAYAKGPEPLARLVVGRWSADVCYAVKEALEEAYGITFPRGKFAVSDAGTWEGRPASLLTIGGRKGYSAKFCRRWAAHLRKAHPGWPQGKIKILGV